MAFDEEMAAKLESGAIDPTLRVYGWSPQAVSIGRHQSMEDFDLLALQRAGIDIVRRPTGGRAIFHANELTYSVVMPCVSTSLKEIYRTINEGLLSGLKLLGVEAELTKFGSDFRRLYAQPSSEVCFSTSAASEIHYQGKKLVGSAQRRFRDVVLQHGSLLLDNQHCAITGFLAERGDDNGDQIKSGLEESTIDAASILGRQVSFKEAAEAIKLGCASAWKIEFNELPESVTAGEIDDCERVLSGIDHTKQFSSNGNGSLYA